MLQDCHGLPWLARQVFGSDPVGVVRATMLSKIFEHRCQTIGAGRGAILV
jgi:hypothetical protein